jgi:predicted AAA+ superfamily ATPase
LVLAANGRKNHIDIAITIKKSNNYARKNYEIRLIHRIVTKLVFEDIENLKSPMSFLSGPRQVGKTLLVRQSAYQYFNWDAAEVKTAALRDP